MVDPATVDGIENLQGCLHKKVEFEKLYAASEGSEFPRWDRSVGEYKIVVDD